MRDPLFEIIKKAADVIELRKGDPTKQLMAMQLAVAANQAILNMERKLHSTLNDLEEMMRY